MLSSLAVVGLGGLAGCHDDPPTPSEVRSRISSDLGNVLHETNAAVSGTSDALPGAAALSMLDGVLGGNVATRVPLAAMTSQLMARATGDGPADATDAIDADAQIQYLNVKLFTDANHVGDGVYQVPPALVCGQTAVDQTGHETQTIDATCAANLAKADLRIRTAKDDGALVFAIQLDADHDEPLILTLTHTSLALTVDLDGAQRAFVALAAVFGEDQPNVALAGQVTGKLEVLGTAKAKLSLAIDRALAIKAAAKGAALDGPDAFVLSSAKAQVASVTLDGAAKSGAFSLGLGETGLKLPRDTDAKRLELDLPGATATAGFAAGKPLALSHIGLGNRTTIVSINGVHAETIDLNPGDGRAFDATVTTDPATGTESFAVTPKLDLQRTIDHAVIGDEPPVYDVTRVVLDGSVRSGGAGDRVEVVTGSFSVTTSPAGHGFSATAGQCVTSTEATDPTTGAPFTQWTVGACQ